MITLNVGLHVNGSKKPVLNALDIATAFEGAGVTVIGFRTVAATLDDGSTEHTAVMCIDGRAVSQGLIYMASVAFEQDCIACRSLDRFGNGGSGYLIGPKADKWGEFNADYFVDYYSNKLEYSNVA